MSKSISWGVIGCGSVTRKSFLPALQQVPQTHLTAIASRSKEKAIEFTQDFEGEPIEGYNNLLRRKDIDAVYIATPVAEHAKVAIEAARQGKHILCEKSIAQDLKTTETIVQVCKENNVALLEGFSYQFHSQHVKVRNLLQDGIIGEVVLFKSSFGFPPLNKNNIRYKKKLGGGSLFDAGCYTVHAARHFFESEPIRVMAVLNSKGYEVDISGSVFLDFDNGKSAQLAFGFNNFYCNEQIFWGSTGRITLKRAFSPHATLEPKLILEKPGIYKIISLEACNQFAEEIQVFCRGLESKQQQVQWSEDVLNQSRVLELIRLS